MFRHNPAKPATPAQLDLLRSMGVETPGGTNSYDADLLIKANIDQWAALPPTQKQEMFLRCHGRWQQGMTRKDAADWISQLKAEAEWEC